MCVSRWPSALRIVVAVLALACWGPNAARAQLSSEMRDLLTELVDELEPDLQERFRQALDRNSSRVVLTPDQFRRFREHPSNPFDGMEDIDPASLRGNIELNFQIPGLRERQPLPLERQHPSFLATLSPVASAAARSVAEVRDGDELLGLCTVVGDGQIVCKASDVLNATSLQIVTGQGRRLPGRVVVQDPANDLALVQFDQSSLDSGERLTPVQWSTRQPLPGEFVVSAAPSGIPAAIGTYSNPPRAMRSAGQGFLGVQPESCSEGVRLVEVNPGGAGQLAGLRAGDVIQQLDGTAVRDVTQLVAEISRRRAGDEIALEILRDGQRQELKAVLAGRDLSAERASKFRMMNRLGAIPSKRSDGLEWVFQHDTPLFPEQCGGPVLDLSGNVIGLNIAREGRVSSLAIPAVHLQTILPNLLRQSIADQRPATGR